MVIISNCDQPTTIDVQRPELTQDQSKALMRVEWGPRMVYWGLGGPKHPTWSGSISTVKAVTTMLEIARDMIAEEIVARIMPEYLNFLSDFGA